MKKTKVPVRETPIWEQGIRFQCQGSGKCCTSHGEYGFVFMNIDDRRRMARHLKMGTSAFTKKYCTLDKGFYHLKEEAQNPDCLFLDGKRCGVYEGRPAQCRTWPFWPDIMNAKTWKNEVVSFCPGVNKGPLITAEKIKKIMAEQTRSEEISEREADQLQRKAAKT